MIYFISSASYQWSTTRYSPGASLFLAYINDLPLAASSSVRLFADDCLLYRRINTTQDTNILQSDLNNLQKWEARCQMMFNTDKCEVLCITLNKKNVICADYTIHCQLQNI